METGLCVAGGREDGALTVDLSAQRIAGWQMVPGIGNGLFGLERGEELCHVLHKCLLFQQNAEILKYSPLKTGLFQPWKAKLSRENAVVIARILPIHHLLLKANTNWLEKEPHVLSCNACFAVLRTPAPHACCFSQWMGRSGGWDTVRDRQEVPNPLHLVLALSFLSYHEWIKDGCGVGAVHPLLRWVWLILHLTTSSRSLDPTLGGIIKPLVSWE